MLLSIALSPRSASALSAMRSRRRPVAWAVRYKYIQYLARIVVSATRETNCSRDARARAGAGWYEYSRIHTSVASIGRPRVVARLAVAARCCYALDPYGYTAHCDACSVLRHLTAAAVRVTRTSYEVTTVARPVGASIGVHS